MTLSAYKGMWLIVMFDLPVDSNRKRKIYANFRKQLLSNGFVMLQYSIYARYCASEDASKTYRNYIKSIIPDEGEVRLLAVTDCQFGKMEVFCGKKRKLPEKTPVQLELF